MTQDIVRREAAAIISMELTPLPFVAAALRLPLGWQNDDLKKTEQKNEPKSIKTKIKQTAKGAVVISPKSGVQLISRPLYVLE